MDYQLTGKNGVARHFRGSKEILPPLGMELNYDFNFQRTNPVLPFRKFLPVVEFVKHGVWIHMAGLIDTHYVVFFTGRSSYYGM